jgi:hypothetical protein
VKKIPSFLLRSEIKQNGSEKLPSFSLQSKTEATFFRFDVKKMFFRLFSHLKRNLNEMKRKQNEKEVKRSEMKNFWKRNKLKIYALLILL